jgi:hypothetical protein
MQVRQFIEFIALLVGIYHSIYTNLLGLGTSMEFYLPTGFPTFEKNITQNSLIKIKHNIPIFI